MYSLSMSLKLAHDKIKKTSRLDYAKGLLRMHKIRSRDLAKQIGVHESAVCHVLAGRKKSRRVQQAIADALDLSFEDLWGRSA